MFYALGADSLLKKQGVFKHYFDKNEKYPLLSKIFEEAVPKIEELGLDQR